MLKRNPIVVFGTAVAIAAGAGQVGYLLGRRAAAGIPRSQQTVIHTSSNQTGTPLVSGPLLAEGQPETWERLTSADRDARLRLFLQRLPSVDLMREIDRLLDQPPQPQRDRDLRLALELLAREDPSTAMKLAGRENNRPMRTFLVAGVVTGWMVRDPASALCWVAERAEAEWTDAAFAQLAQLESQRALQLAQALPAENREFRWNAFRAVVQGQLAEGRYADATTVIDRTADSELRMFLAATVADAWARYQPRAAAEWIAALPDSSERSQILVHVGSMWASQQPHEAADFAVNLSPGESRQQMLTHALVEWVGKDLAAASRWADRLEPQPENDAAVATIATDETLIRIKPHVALSWAESLVTREARLQAIQIIVQQWSSRDDAGARRYVQSAPGLTLEDRTELLAVLHDTGGSQ